MRSSLLVLGCVACAVLAACEDDGGVPIDVGLPPLQDAAPKDRGLRCVPQSEVCNAEDDDCDGLIDEAEGVRAQVFGDVEHCGACFQACAGPDAEYVCRVGQCVIVACTPGFGDYNGDPADGCETDCVITAGGREICDDGDNDCDGAVDEGFDLQSDPAHCGGCTRACPPPPGGRATCVEGQCAIEGCEPGFVDLDGVAANGCEYRCTPRGTDGAREACNGIDDDCDGRVDEAVDRVPPPDTCGDAGVCGPVCDGADTCPPDEDCLDGICVPRDVPDLPCDGDAACQAVHPGLACLADVRLVDGEPVSARRCAPRGHGPVCDGPAGYRCVRPLDFQLGDEFGLCDTLDNDCDGRVDEDYAGTLLLDDRQTARPCSAGQGACLREGTVVCAEGGRGTTCSARAGEPLGLRDDACDGVDADCDGRIDEDHPDDWLPLPGGGEIFAYEASRPGATDERAGRPLDPDVPGGVSIEARACSRPGALPWADVTWDEAEAACAALGARLCTGEEWGAACGGPGEQGWPYGDAFDGQACNGGAFDADPAAPGDQDRALPTGARLRCARGGVHDLSGNVKEWTADRRDDLRVVRGGGYGSNLADGLRCDQVDDLKDPALRHPAIGFRCCR